MATKNIVPRADGEGGLGTAAKKWGAVHADALTGPLTGDVNGNLTGDVTGDITGNVSGSSGSCTGNSATATTATTAATATTVVDNAITLAKMAHGTDGELITYDAAGAPAAVATGAATEVLTSNGAGAAPTFQAPAGGGGGICLQEVYTASGAVATGTTVTPRDDTIPTTTEGDEYMTLAITAGNASNIVEVEVSINYSHTATSTAIVTALFQDGGATPVAVGQDHSSNASTAQSHVTLRYRGVVGTTSPTTFKVRIGAQTAGTLTFNGQGGARFYGGSLESSIRITEFSV